MVIERSGESNVIEEPKSKKAVPPVLFFSPRINPESKNNEVSENTERNGLKSVIVRKYTYFVEKFSDFLSKSQENSSKSTTLYDYRDWFECALYLAETQYGEQAAKTYQDLYDAAKSRESGDSKNQKDPKLLRYLGFSLNRAGYSEQARELLTYYVDNYGLQELGDSDSLSEELIKAGQQEVAVRMLDTTMNRVQELKSLIYQDTVYFYRTYYQARFDGSFTESGDKKLIDFFEERKGQVVSTEQVHSFILGLRETGDYMFNKTDIPFRSFKGNHSRYFIYRKNISKLFPTDSSSWGFDEDINKLSGAATELSRSAVALANQSPQTAEAFLSTAKEITGLVILSSRQISMNRIYEWEDQYDGTYFDPEKGLGDFVRQLENHPRTERSFDYDYGAVSEIYHGLNKLLSDKKLITEGLDLLYSLEPGLKKTETFDGAARYLPIDSPPAIFERFMQEWEKTAVQTCEGFSENYFIEEKQVLDISHILKHDTHIRPKSPLDIHFFQAQQFWMAECYLRRNEPNYQAQGIKILQSLAEETSGFFNPYQYISHSQFLFGDPQGYTSHLEFEFQQAPFKTLSLLKGIYLAHSDEDSRILRNQAFELIQKIGIDPETETFSSVENKTFTLMEMDKSLSEAGEADKALAFYNLVGFILYRLDKINKIKLSENQETPSSFSSEAVEKEKIEFWNIDYKTRLRASLIAGLESTGRQTEATQIVSELMDFFKIDETYKDPRLNLKSMIAATEIVTRFGRFKNEATELYETLIDKFGFLSANIDRLNPFEFTYYDEYQVFYLATSISDSSLPEEAKDGLLKQLVTAIAPNDNRDWGDMFKFSSTPPFTLVETLINDKTYPAAELEALSKFSVLLDNANRIIDISDSMELQDCWRLSHIVKTIKGMFRKLTI